MNEPLNDQERADRYLSRAKEQADIYHHQMRRARNALPVEDDPKFTELFDGRKIEWVIIEECDDLADLSDEYPAPSIPKLIAKLAFRMTLVIALAVGVLAVFA